MNFTWWFLFFCWLQNNCQCRCRSIFLCYLFFFRFHRSSLPHLLSIAHTRCVRISGLFLLQMANILNNSRQDLIFILFTTNSTNDRLNQERNMHNMHIFSYSADYIVFCIICWMGYSINYTSSNSCYCCYYYFYYVLLSFSIECVEIPTK